MSVEEASSFRPAFAARRPNTGCLCAAQPINALSPIGQAVAIAGKYMRAGDLQASDSLAQIRTWVCVPTLRVFV